MIGQKTNSESPTGPCLPSISWSHQTGSANSASLCQGHHWWKQTVPRLRPNSFPKSINPFLARFHKSVDRLHILLHIGMHAAQIDLDFLKFSRNPIPPIWVFLGGDSSGFSTEFSEFQTPVALSVNLHGGATGGKGMNSAGNWDTASPEGGGCLEGGQQLAPGKRPVGRGWLLGPRAACCCSAGGAPPARKALTPTRPPPHPTRIP